VDHFGARRVPSGVAREHHMAAAGQQAGQRSKVLRPMIIGLPMVSALNRLRSAGMCQASLPASPIVPSSARATIRNSAAPMAYFTSRVTWPILRPGRVSALP
jgi:hypothetical protein